MSWSLIVPKSSKEDFPAAVDAAQFTGQSADVPGIQEDVAAAKGALKALAGRVKRTFVQGSAGGHCLEPGQAATWFDGITVNVSGSDEP